MLQGISSSVRPNITPDFLAAIVKSLDGESHPPEAIFAYIYAALYSPSYRIRYGEFLKRNFPRVPLPRNSTTFLRLATIGQHLIELHLLRSGPTPVINFPKAGNNRVEKIEFKADATDPTHGYVFINSVQFFEGVPTSVWDYTIGSYQVAHKWLKDRKGRLLTFDELRHYGQIIAALNETIRLQANIDDAMGA